MQAISIQREPRAQGRAGKPVFRFLLRKTRRNRAASNAAESPTSKHCIPLPIMQRTARIPESRAAPVEIVFQLQEQAGPAIL
jgi:hypothetical protein